MKQILIWLLILLGSVSHSYLIAQIEVVENPLIEFEIGGVKVVGAKNTDTDLIIARSGLSVGQKMKKTSILTSQAIRNLMKTRLFADVQILEKRRIGEFIFLEIQVQELPRLEKFTLVGLKKKKHRTELTALLTDLLPESTALTKNLHNVVKIKVAEYLEQQGLPNAEIKLIENKNPLHPDRIDLVFKIDTKHEIKTARITFSGNDNVSATVLRKQMTQTKAGQLFGKSEFIESDFKQDKTQILTHYRTLGYRDAEILDVQKVTNKEGELFLHLQIEEGQQYQFGGIKFTGNSIYADKLLSKIFDIKTGDIYNETLLEERLFFSPDGSDLSSLYLDNGYLFFQVQPIETAIRNNKIDLELRINEGREAIIGKVTITGNDKTSEQVIRRELRTRPGDKFSRAAIIRSQRELVNMGYFNPQTLDVKTHINPKNGTVDIEYIVEEKANDQLELSASWQNGLVGTVGVSFNNFSVKNLLKGEQPFGDGQQIGLRAQSSGKTYQALNFSFSEPWLGGKKPQNLSFGAYYSRYASSSLNENGEIPYLRIIGTSVGLSRRLDAIDDYLFSTTNLTLENIDLFEYTSIKTDEGGTLDQGNFNNFYIKQSFTRNTTDQPFFPRKGSIIELSGQFTLPYSLLGQGVTDNYLEYHKWRIGADFYLPVGKKATFRTSVQAGFLGRYNANVSRSPFERFELDGDPINGQGANITGNDFIYMRGYEQEDFAAVTNGGAAIFNKVTAEFRYPLLQSSMASAYGLVFAEAGNAWDDFGTYNPFDLKRSVGAGLRVQVPMIGLIGFDYSLGLDSDYFDKSNWWKSGKFSLILGFEPK